MMLDRQTTQQGAPDSAIDSYVEHTQRVRGALAKVLVELNPGDIPNHAVGVLHMVLKELYWPRLRRSCSTPDEAYGAAFDPKMPERTVVYVPHGDRAAMDFWERCRDALASRVVLDVRELPVQLTPADEDRLSREGGFLALAHDELPDGSVRYPDYYVPGGRFNEIYGWDTDFMAMGLLEDGNIDAVRSMIRHHLAEIETFGRVLNANRAYYLTRGQPPLFMHLVRSYAEHLSPERRADERAFLARCVRAGAKEYDEVWDAHPHRTPNGLARYYDPRRHFPPETEDGHFHAVVAPYARSMGCDVEEYIRRFHAGEIENPALEEFVMHDGALRESGHDTSNAFVGRAAHLNTVDLNALLYKMAEDIAALLENDFGGALAAQHGDLTAAAWHARAEKRAAAMREILWDDRAGLFQDVDFVRGTPAPYMSPRLLYPLWAGMATPEEARRIVAEVLPKLEERGGLVASDRASRGPVDDEHPQRQWDYPAGWAPHQMIAWEGLLRYGERRAAQRLIYKWLYMIVENWVRTWCIVEKYDVVTATKDFHAEYGNVGTEQGLLDEGAGFGWTNASFQRGFALLEPAYRDALERMVPPDSLFPEAATLPPAAAA